MWVLYYQLLPDPKKTAIIIISTHPLAGITLIYKSSPGGGWLYTDEYVDPMWTQEEWDEWENNWRTENDSGYKKHFPHYIAKCFLKSELFDRDDSWGSSEIHCESSTMSHLAGTNPSIKGVTTLG